MLRARLNISFLELPTVGGFNVYIYIYDGIQKEKIRDTHPWSGMTVRGRTPIRIDYYRYIPTYAWTRGL